TNVLAKVYQLYMVEYQCASMLINHNQGMVEPTVNAKNTTNTEAQMVLVKLKLFASCKVICRSSVRSESCLILRPTRLHTPSVIIVHVKKNAGLKNPLFCFRMGSRATSSLSTQ